MPAERMPHADDALLSQPLAALTALALRFPRSVAAAAVGLALVAVVVTICGLEFKTSRLDLLSPRSEYNQRWLAHLEEFGARDDAVVVVRAAEPAAVQAAVDRLGGKLAEKSDFFESVLYRVDLAALRHKALHFAPQAEFEQLLARVSQASVLSAVGREPFDLARAFESLNRHLETVRPGGDDAWRAAELQYETLAVWLGGGLQALAPGREASGAAGTNNSSETLAGIAQLEEFSGPRYLTAEGGQTAFILLKLRDEPAAGATPAIAIARLRHELAEFQKAEPGVWAGLTGMPVIEHDEMAASQFDMIWTSLASLAVVAALFAAAYGGLRHAALASLVLLLGMAYSFGVVTLTVGHLNILSSAFGVVLVGLGIDFSIHYVAGYLDRRRCGQAVQPALLETARAIGPGVVTGAVTTAAAFFCAGLTEFTGVRELGVVAGLGVLLCLAATVIALPPLILLFDPAEAGVLPRLAPVSRAVRLSTGRPRLMLAAALGLSVLCVLGVGGLRYDHNLLNLQPAHVESSGIERELFLQLDDSVWFAVSACENPADLLARKAQFAALPVVSKTEEIATLLPASPRRRQQEIAWAADELARLPTAAPPVRIALPDLLRELAQARALLTRSPTHETPTQQQIARLEQALQNVPAEAAPRVARGVESLAERLLKGLAPLRACCDPAPPLATDLPRELTERYIGRTQKHLLKVYAKGSVWDLDALGQFVSELEAIDPRITGHPVQTYYASQHMQQSYLQSGLYALAAVFVLLCLDFRNLGHALLAMGPLALAAGQLAGVIGWFDIPLNAANMIVMPLLLGIGVDDGVHLVHEMRRQRGPFRLRNSTAVAVLLTSTTTLASFGMLILARHQGLRSLGQVLALGVFLCVIASLAFYPACLRLLTAGRRKAMRPIRFSPIARVASESPPLRREDLSVGHTVPALETKPPATTLATTIAPEDAAPTWLADLTAAPQPAPEQPDLAPPAPEQALAVEPPHFPLADLPQPLTSTLSPAQPFRLPSPEVTAADADLLQQLLLPQPPDAEQEPVWLRLDEELPASPAQALRRRALPRRTDQPAE